MAANTIAGNVHVVEIRREPGDSAVTIIAGIAARDVGWVLARCSYAVMTGSAAPDDLRVIDCQNRRPGVRCVAVLADVRRLDVCGCLSGRVRPVVATNAITRDVCMIECRG